MHIKNIEGKDQLFLILTESRTRGKEAEIAM